MRWYNVDGCVVPRVVSVHAPVFSGDLHEKVDAAIRSRLRVLFDEVLDERDGPIAVEVVVQDTRSFWRFCGSCFWLERALAISALVLRTGEALGAFVSGAATIAASCLRTFAC